MIDREKIIDQAYVECMCEMYAKAQPSADYKKLLEDVKNGKITDSPYDPVYSRYYLSYEECKYILNKYINAYGMTEKWNDYLDVVERYYKGEGRKDIWRPEYIGDDGFKHPGYRTSEAVPHIKDAISNKLIEYIDNEDVINNISKELSHLILSYIDNCRNYYRFDREESNFSVSVSLGCSPTSNSDSVVEYWKKQGVEVEIIERNPMLLWDMDYYGDEFEEVMIDEYGDDWVNKTWEIYYNSRDGKKKIVTDFMRNNKDFNRYYVKNDDNGELIVVNFDNSNEEIPIDDFIKKYNIKGKIYKFKK